MTVTVKWKRQRCASVRWVETNITPFCVNLVLAKTIYIYIFSFSDFSIYTPSEHKPRGRDQRVGSQSGETSSRKDEKKRREARSWT